MDRPTNLLERLASEFIVRLLVGLHLFFAKIHLKVIESYERLTAAQCARPPRGQDCAASEPKQPSSRAPPKYDPSWDWNGFPPPLPLTISYTRFSTCWMVYILIRTAYHDQIARFISPHSEAWFGLPGNCLMLGRTIFHPTFADASVNVFSICHLIWRSVRYFSRRIGVFSLVSFLMHSDADAERFTELLELDDSRAAAPTPATAQYEWLPPGGTISHCSDLSAACNSPDVLNEQANVNELLMRYTMCYSCDARGRFYYKLRPNRTQAARRLLKTQTVKMFLIATAFLALVGLPFAANLFYFCLDDRRYVKVYPGCFPQLDQLHAGNNLTRYSVTLRGHHLVATAVEIVENCIVWFDNAFSVFYVSSFVCLMSFDLELYLKSLQARLKDVTGRTIARNCSDLKVAYFQRRVGPFKRQTFHHGLCRELDKDKIELQFAMNDFFREAKRVDALMSEFIAMGLYTWLGVCASVGYNYLVHNRGPIVIHVRLLMVTVFMATFLVSNYLLRPRQRSLVCYSLLCSLVASDQTRDKRRLLRMMDLFTKSSGSTYTILHVFPYKKTTYIAFLGSSLSCFFVAITLFGHDAKGNVK